MPQGFAALLHSKALGAEANEKLRYDYKTYMYLGGDKARALGR